MKQALLIALTCAIAAVGCGGSSDTTIPSAPALSAGTYQLVTVNGSPLPFTDPTSGSKITSGVCVIRTDATFTATFTLTGGSAPGTQVLSGFITPIDARTAAISFSNGAQTTGTLTSTGFVATVGLVSMAFTKQ